MSRGKISKKSAEKMKQVSELFERNPPNLREEMEKLGFEWFYDDEEEEHEAEMEEARATPQNLNQERLVAYFEGQIDFSRNLLNIFKEEKEVEEPNYPLFRRYFKSGNENLKKLLFEGLRSNPSDESLLSDLWFFHEHRPMLGELVKAYLRGCKHETNLKKFKNLAQDFYDNTCLYGYDAFQALHESDLGPEKKAVVQRLQKKEKAQKAVKIVCIKT